VIVLDEWTEDEDIILAEAVLRHIREGSTMLNAFDEVGIKLNRASAACGFYWNAFVSKDYHNAIAIAKRERSLNK
jgi:prespore-specific regulator